MSAQVPKTTVCLWYDHNAEDAATEAMARSQGYGKGHCNRDISARRHASRLPAIRAATEHQRTRGGAPAPDGRGQMVITRRIRANRAACRSRLSARPFVPADYAIRRPPTSSSGAGAVHITAPGKIRVTNSEAPRSAMQEPYDACTGPGHVRFTTSFPGASRSWPGSPWRWPR